MSEEEIISPRSEVFINEAGHTDRLNELFIFLENFLLKFDLSRSLDPSHL